MLSSINDNDQPLRWFIEGADVFAGSGSMRLKHEHGFLFVQL